MQLPVMQFALFPFAFVSNMNLFPNTITDKIGALPSKNQTNKQNKTKEDKKNNKKRPLKQCMPWTLHSEFRGISRFPLFIEKTTIIHCAHLNSWRIL